jgi:hypothetical protein
MYLQVVDSIKRGSWNAWHISITQSIS